MNERIRLVRKDKSEKPSNLRIPTKLEIQNYLREVADREPFDLSGEISEKTKGVRIINEKGVFLGFGQIGQYDWFIMTHNSKRRKTDKRLHHGNSSTTYNMTTLRPDIYIETDELNKIIRTLTE